MRVLLVLVLVALSGCCGGHIRAAEIEETMRAVVSRHQTYVKTDETLSPEPERRVYLRDGAVLLEALDAALPVPEKEKDDG